MKSLKLRLIKVLVSVGIVLLSSGTVRAAEVRDQKESNVTLEVLSGGLKITQAEHLDFGKLMLDGQDHVQFSMGQGEEVVTVSDFLGEKANWDLHVKYGDEVYPAKGLSLSLKPKLVAPLKSQGIELAAEFKVSTEAMIFAQTKPGDYRSGFAHELATGSSLFVPATAPAGRLDTTLVWTLVADF